MKRRGFLQTLAGGAAASVAAFMPRPVKAEEMPPPVEQPKVEPLRPLPEYEGGIVLPAVLVESWKLETIDLRPRMYDHAPYVPLRLPEPFETASEWTGTFMPLGREYLPPADKTLWVPTDLWYGEPSKPRLYAPGRVVSMTKWKRAEDLEECELFVKLFETLRAPDSEARRHSKKIARLLRRSGWTT